MEYDGKVASSIDFIEENINAIQAQVDNASFLQQTNTFNFSKYDELYSLINNCINTYYNSTNSLLNELKKQVGSISSYGKSMEDMDKDIARNAGDLQ